MDIKLHPKALFKKLRVVQYNDTIKSCNMRVEPVESNSPKTHPFWPGSAVSGNNKNLIGLSEAEQYAATMLLSYIHEAGEHIIVPGCNINQHYKDGAANALRLLEVAVLPWLREIVDKEICITLAPEEFVP